MAKTTNPTKAIATNNITRKMVEEKIESALAELKPALGEKKFKRRIKKAGKLIINGLEKKIEKAKAQTEKPVVNVVKSTKKTSVNK